MTRQGFSRRAVLLGGLAAVSTALAACGPSSQPSTPSSSVQARLTALETKFGGRLGVYAIDTGNRATVRYRADERFLMCSTAKVLAVAAILRLNLQQPGLLDRIIHYDTSQVLAYAPVTSRHVADGMTVSALCDAALTVSDNTAANLLVRTLGGPPTVTAFARSLGDSLTRADRIEPDLNVGAPGDQRDTSAPAQMATDLGALVLGDALDPAGRDLLTGWLKANTTGGKSIRAGLPANWQVADKTGSGAHNEVNDIAVVWPPNHAPLIITSYTAPTDPHSTAGYATVANAATIVANTLVPT